MCSEDYTGHEYWQPFNWRDKYEGPSSRPAMLERGLGLMSSESTLVSRMIIRQLRGPGAQRRGRQLKFDRAKRCKSSVNDLR
jgi:hypothetical protein